MFKNSYTGRIDKTLVSIAAGLALILLSGVVAIVLFSKPLTCDKGQTVHTSVRVMPVVVNTGKSVTVTTSTQVFEYCA